MQEFAPVVDTRVQVSSVEWIKFPRRLTRMIAAIKEGVTVRDIEQIIYLAYRDLRGDVESRISDGRVDVRLKDPKAVARRAETGVVEATEFVVQMVEDQERSEQTLLRFVFEGHYPFLELSEKERLQMGWNRRFRSAHPTDTSTIGKGHLSSKGERTC